MNFKFLASIFTFTVLLLFSVSNAAKIAYIYGDVSAEGAIPSGAAAPFHQMLLTDTGDRGCSQLKALVEAKGHTIVQYYDQETVLTDDFLREFDVVIFGLHQKQWSAAEKAALDRWIRAGGSIFLYSDSAAGGLHTIVGGSNPVGQRTVNNIITQYGMQVCVDQCNGVKAYRAGPGATHPIVINRPIWEGEGVSPVALDPTSGAIALIPYENSADYKVSGDPTISNKQNITIQNPKWAALALQQVGSGHVLVAFDRQPMWNNGEGSSIQKRDNRLILGRIVDFATSNQTSTTPRAPEAFYSSGVPGNAGGFFSMPGYRFPQSIALPEIIKMSVCELSGKAVMSMNVTNNHAFWNCRDNNGRIAPHGIYIVRFFGKTKNHSIRIAVTD